MKKKLLLAAAVLGIALTGAWTQPAAAIYQFCGEDYCSMVAGITNCTCPGTTRAAKCNNWQSGGCELP